MFRLLRSKSTFVLTTVILGLAWFAQEPRAWSQFCYTPPGGPQGCAVDSGPGPSSVAHPPVNRGPSLAEIRRMQQQQAAEEAERRYNAAVKVEQSVELQNAADRKSAEAAVEQARQDFLRERDKLASLLRDAASGTISPRDDSGSSLTLRDDSPQPPAASQPQNVSKWGKEPPLPSSIGRALASDIPTSVDTTAASEYLGRATGFVRDQALKSADSAARRSALSGEMFAEAEMGPYGMTTVVMMNVATLPKYVFRQIDGVVTGQISPDEAMGMTIHAVNHIFDFGTPVNSAIEGGATETIRGEVTGQAKASLAALAASCLPVQDEVKQSIASQSKQVADTAMAAYKHIFTPSTNDQ